MILFFESMGFKNELFKITNENGNVRYVKSFPLPLPFLYFFLKYFNIKTRYLDSQVSRTYLLRSFIRGVYEDVRLHGLKFFLDCLLLSIAFFKPAESLLFRISDQENNEIFIERQPKLFGFRPLFAPVIKQYRDDCSTLLFILSSDSERRFMPSFTSMKQSGLVRTFEINKPQRVLSRELHTEVTVINGKHCVDSGKNIICTTPFEIRPFAEFPFEGIVSYRQHNMMLNEVQIAQERKDSDSTPLFLGYCHSPNNYYHFIVEVLPRILFTLPVSGEPTSCLLDSAAPSQIKEICNKILGKAPTIVNLAESHLRFNQLEILRDYRYSKLVDFHESTVGVNCFSSRKNDLLLVKTALERSFFTNSVSGERPLNKKVFVTRPSSFSRNPQNLKEIETALMDRGIEVLETSIMTTAQQIALFASCEKIVSLSGASLTNLMFCNPRTRVSVIPSDADSSTDIFWRDFANIFKLDFECIRNVAVYGRKETYTIQLGEVLKEFD